MRIHTFTTFLVFAGVCIGGVFPAPHEQSRSGSDFVLDDSVVIAIPAQPSDEDRFLARFLSEALSDRWGVHLKTATAEALDPGRRAIVINRPQTGIAPEEGYVVDVSSERIVAQGADERGTFYALQSLRQLIGTRDGRVYVEGVHLRDWPDKPFRGIKLYLPGRQNIPFFKRFVRDFVALYKYNTLIVEMNASMRLDRHPELNSGWLKFARDTTYSRRNYPPGAPHDIEQNSTHQDIADGDILEKAEVADLARFIRQYHIELIPELPSFTHSYYLLSEHKDLSEVPGEKWPDTYCPSNPASYKLLFDVYDEYIEVLKPRIIHAGHDELFLPVGLCPRCGNKDIGERYGEDVRKIHDYLAGKGIRMAIWGDMLLEGVRGKGLQKKTAPDGWTYYAPGGMTPEQVARLIPKDILIFNWFWGEERSEEHEARLDEMGFRQVYGNFDPSIKNYAVRRRRATLLGGAPSAWFATGEFGFGKDLLSDFLGCSNILWTGKVIDGRELSGIVQERVPEIRRAFRGEPPPSETEAAAVPLKLAAPLTVATNRAGAEAAFAVGVDPTSLIFVQAAAHPANNREMFRVLWDMEDTADLLGWYEVVYEDGYVVTIPIRYGVNIQEAGWAARDSAHDYCYGADAEPQPDGTTYFAFEWMNPRLGKVIREIRLRSTNGFRGASEHFINDYGPPIPGNEITLRAVKVVKRRE
ncbi:MAG TPA: beta-N-acetylhexosaminidase [Bryobacteraceae bacterium]|nr:beta-N-acetylhexosaminidase [Bryobacteraceae bacterium]